MSRRKRAGKAASAAPPVPAAKPAAPAAAPSTARSLRVRRTAWTLAALGLLIAALAFFWLRRDAVPVASEVAVAPAAPTAARTVEPARPAYVDNQLCIGCHQEAPLGAFGVVTNVSAASNRHFFPRRNSATDGRPKSGCSGTGLLTAPWMSASTG